jgi:hypothetical protein
LLEDAHRLFQPLIDDHGHPDASQGPHLLTQARDALSEITPMTHVHHALSQFEDMPPQERLTLAASRAMHSARLGLLKFSLRREFQPSIIDKVSEGENPLQFHQELTQAKARLLGSMMEKVMGSPTKEMMLAHIKEAERDHDALWRTTWKRPHGGQTAELLKNMRSKVERFQQGTGLDSPTGLGS